MGTSSISGVPLSGSSTGLSTLGLTEDVSALGCYTPGLGSSYSSVTGTSIPGIFGSTVLGFSSSAVALGTSTSISGVPASPTTHSPLGTSLSFGALGFGLAGGSYTAGSSSVLGGVILLATSYTAGVISGGTSWAAGRACQQCASKMLGTPGAGRDPAAEIMDSTEAYALMMSECSKDPHTALMNSTRARTVGSGRHIGNESQIMSQFTKDPNTDMMEYSPARIVALGRRGGNNAHMMSEFNKDPNAALMDST